MLAGFAWFSVFRLKTPQILSGIQHDMESAVAGQQGVIPVSGCTKPETFLRLCFIQAA